VFSATSATFCKIWIEVLTAKNANDREVGPPEPVTRNAKHGTRNGRSICPRNTRKTRKDYRQRRGSCPRMARMIANADAHGNYGIFLPLITSLCQGSGWQARINADWM